MARPTDEENICLKCKNAMKYDGSYSIENGVKYTMCFCMEHFGGKNAGRRRTCKSFESIEGGEHER